MQGAQWYSNGRRVGLIKSIMDRCGQCDSAASYAALDLARKPDDEKLQAAARLAVAKMDALHSARDVIVNLVNMVWPSHETIKKLAESAKGEG